MKKKKTNMRAVIRKIVREEVANAIGEVITELQKPTQSTKPLTPKKAPNFLTKDYINDLLEELESPTFLSEYHFIEDNGQKAE